MHFTKPLIVFGCTLAFASAGWIPFFGGHHKEEHHPVIHDGVPIDTPEVQHARAEHLAAVAEAKSHAGYQEGEEHHYGGQEEHSFGSIDDHGLDLGHNDHGSQSEHTYSYSIQHVAKPSYHEHDFSEHTAVVSLPGAHYEHSYPAYETTHHEPIVDHDGKPLDTPEVEKAKALHFAEVHKALARLQDHGHALHKRDASEYTVHVAHDDSYGHQVPIYGYDQHSFSEHHEIPQIDHDGKPLDTAEVEHAKALHFAAHHEALARIAHAKSHHGSDGLSYHY